MFLSKNKKNIRVFLSENFQFLEVKPQFYYIKVGFKGVKIIKVCFRDDITEKL